MYTALLDGFKTLMTMALDMRVHGLKTTCTVAVARTTGETPTNHTTDPDPGRCARRLCGTWSVRAAWRDVASGRSPTVWRRALLPGRRRLVRRVLRPGGLARPRVLRRGPAERSAGQRRGEHRTNRPTRVRPHSRPLGTRNRHEGRETTDGTRAQCQVAPDGLCPVQHPPRLETSLARACWG